MKQLKKISLSQISKKEMEKRELNQLLGGVNCCICGCLIQNSALDSGNSGHANNDSWEGGGYGSGAFGG
ncbi:TIGR04149 family rSAM-modified RiPP [Phocaeicola coprophilus]|jgi:natural product precursor|uniref:TIGR04149 family rSAM-modified RiPP n=1 Tax=Phocaeicola coprophilus TaxID=387090 RepID=UPI002659297A|nr:TIGR04149 family rSAM-modified RiPP [Phocaeicola coprophilus]